MIWWGHKKHGEVKDELVDRIVARVNAGKMGFITNHSAHFSKALKKLLGTPSGWTKIVADGTLDKIMVKTDRPDLQRGDGYKFPKIERYGEPFRCPTPEAVPLSRLSAA